MLPHDDYFALVNHRDLFRLGYNRLLSFSLQVDKVLELGSEELLLSIALELDKQGQ